VEFSTPWKNPDLCCPVCHDIFKDPVILACTHSFCKVCLQSWWTEKPNRECPVCKQRHLKRQLPSNLVLRNLCESFLEDKRQRGSEFLCSLHSEELKLYCLDHQQPVCVVCRDSEKHSNHTFRPIDEAAQQHRKQLQETLEPLKNKLKVSEQVKVKFDQTTQHIQLQARITERFGCSCSVMESHSMKLSVLFLSSSEGHTTFEGL
uniref:RING-type domain-containing protein n=1 Tax=Acanthochromis polyacanthus TaxID=80966 RepID=A0A3Q1EAX5_9TELE